MHSKKRLFIGLFLLFTTIVLMVLAYLIFYLRKPDTLIFQSSIYVLIGFLAALVGISLLVLTILVISLLKGKPLAGFNRLVQKTLVFFFPLLLQLGKLLHISTEQIQSSFIEINNRLLEAKKIKVPAQKLLLLLPHCLQYEGCPHKITRNPFNCRRCGSCSIGKLVEMADQWQFQIQVVTGGTLARRAVSKLKPHLILAVACERDLSSGIVDSYPMPVCGVLNERPEGPCFNTMVSLDSLEEKVRSILE
ncbi:MAG: DUF116 domain-containing protein [Bacillota bacterium]